MINWTGIASIVLFYILILAVGMWAARKNTGGGDQEVRGERNLERGNTKNESNLGQEAKVWELLVVEFQGQKAAESGGHQISFGTFGSFANIFFPWESPSDQTPSTR